MVKLNELLKKGNDTYDFNFEIAGDKSYYAQQYNEKEVHGKDGNTSLNLAVHEAFHMFQIKNWNEENAIQDKKNYPINKDLLALQLLINEITAKMPAETNKAKVTEYLKMYVAIRSKEIEIDPSSKN